MLFSMEHKVALSKTVRFAKKYVGRPAQINFPLFIFLFICQILTAVFVVEMGQEGQVLSKSAALPTDTTFPCDWAKQLETKKRTKRPKKVETKIEAPGELAATRPL